LLGGGRKGTAFEDGEEVLGDENAESNASNPKKSLELVWLLFSVEEACLWLFVDDENGANGSDPKGSESKAAFVVDGFDFRLENGSKESSRFADVDKVVLDTGAKGSPKAFEETGSDFSTVDDDGHAGAKGSDAAAVDIPPKRLKGSWPPKLFVGLDFPKAVVTGAVKGSSLSWNGSAPVKYFEKKYYLKNECFRFHEVILLEGNCSFS